MTVRILALVLAAVVIGGCGGHMVDGDPVGVTNSMDTLTGPGGGSGGTPPPPPASLVGTWLNSGGYWTVTITFAANGTYSSSYCYYGDCETDYGTWRAQGDWIIFDGDDWVEYWIQGNTLYLDGDPFIRS